MGALGILDGQRPCAEVIGHESGGEVEIRVCPCGRVNPARGCGSGDLDSGRAHEGGPSVSVAGLR